MNIKKIINVGVFRGGAAGVALLANIYTVRNLGKDEAGSVFLYISYGLFLSTFVGFGSVSLALQKLSDLSIDINRHIFGAIKFTSSIAFVLSPFALTIGFCFNNNYYCLVLFYAWFYSLSQTFHYSCIARDKVLLTYLVQNWLPSMVMVISSFYKSILFVLLGQCLSYFISIAIHYYMLYDRSGNDLEHNKVPDDKLNFSIRFNYFQQDVLGQVFTSITIILASFSLSTSQVSILSIYQRLSSVCNILISIVNVSYYSRAVSHLRESSNVLFFKLHKQTVVVNIIFVISYYCLVYFSWGFLLSFYKVILDFKLYSIVHFSYLFVAVSGFSQMVLNSFGHSGYVRNVSWFVFMFGISSIVVLGKFYDIRGVVLGLSLVLVFQSLLNFAKVKMSVR